MSKCTFRYRGVRKIVWNEHMASAVARRIQKSSFHHSFGRRTSPERRKGCSDHVRNLRLFHHSFGRPTRTKWRDGCASVPQICISPQFWASDEHEVTRGLRRQSRKFVENEVTRGLPRQREKFEQFWASDEHEVTRGLSPAATYQTYPAEKKRRNFKEEQHFRRAAVSATFSAALLSSFSQQLFSAAFLSSSSQQPFSAALLSSLLSSSSRQLFSAALLSSFSQLSSLLWSGVGGQLAAFLSSFSQRLFSAAFLSNHPQLSSCCGQGLVVKYATVL